MEKLRGELWKGRAVDEKLKSSLEWPKQVKNFSHKINWLSQHYSKKKIIFFFMHINCVSGKGLQRIIRTLIHVTTAIHPTSMDGYVVTSIMI